MKWFRMYHDLVDDPKVQKLPGETFKFWINLLCLASRSPERGTIQMQLPDLAFALRMDDQAVHDMLSDLVSRGLVHEMDGSFEIHNWQGRQYDSDSSTERVRKHREDAKRSGNVTETLHDRSGNVTPSVSVSSSVSESDSVSVTSTLDERFERFWQVYPKKRSKGDARKWWTKHKPSDELTDTMIAAVQKLSRSKDWTKEGGQFIPYPASWLNDEGWSDEPVVTTAIRIVPKPVEQMTEREKLEAEYQSYVDDWMKGYGMTRVREMKRIKDALNALDEAAS